MTQSPHDPQMPHSSPTITPTGGTLAKLSDSEARTWCTFIHLAGFAVFLPLGHIVGPLILWLIKKDEHPDVDRHGREAINFQVSWTIWGFIAAMSVLIFVGFVLIPIVGIAWIVLVILATMKANKGEFYKYPLTIRFF